VDQPDRHLATPHHYGERLLPNDAHDTLTLRLVAGFTRRSRARPSPRPGRSARR
jgi:hypothetical protein